MAKFEGRIPNDGWEANQVHELGKKAKQRG
jgi:hypothetical protein